jgi:tRNA nucleotidyltransferase (CCA-adding enzyme)
VRDLLRDQPPKDYDVCTSALPEAVLKVFRRVIPTGLEHGTVSVVLRGEHVEVTTFRSEGDYLDGRRPSSVSFHTDIEADLSRRDFTVNAMAFDPVKQELVDPFGGQADLAARCMRCVGSAAARFGEDGLRALRAVRFATVLDFEIDPATEAAIGPTLPVFQKVALERVNQEFVKLLLAPHAPRGLELLRRTGLLAAFFPQARLSSLPLVAHAPAELPVRLALLCLDAADPRGLLLALKFPNKLADAAAHLVAHRQLPEPSASDATLRRWLARVGEGALVELLALNRALGAEPGALGERLTAVLAARPPLSAKALALDGQGVMKALGVGPSPLIGQATRYLLDCVLDEPSKNTPEGLAEALSAWPGRAG